MLSKSLLDRNAHITVTASGVHDPESPGGAQGVPASLGDLKGLEELGRQCEMLDGGTFNADKAYKDSKVRWKCFDVLVLWSCVAKCSLVCRLHGRPATSSLPESYSGDWTRVAAAFPPTASLQALLSVLASFVTRIQCSPSFSTL